MIAYIRVVEAPKRTSGSGLRHRVAEGTWGDDEFKVTTLFQAGGTGSIFFKRKGHPEVEIDLTSLAEGVFIAQDEADPHEPDWQPMTQRVEVNDNGVQRPVRDDEEVWANDLYTAFVDRDEGLIHIAYHRSDKAAVRDWRHAQHIKNDIAGPTAEGVEVFPAEDRLIDLANQYHIWCTTDPIPLGFNEGRQVLTAAAVADMMIGAKQR